MCTARQFASAREFSLFMRGALPSHAETFFVLPREVFAPQKIFCLSAKLSPPRRNFFFCLSPYFYGFTVCPMRPLPSGRFSCLSAKNFFAVTFAIPSAVFLQPYGFAQCVLSHRKGSLAFLRKFFSSQYLSLSLSPYFYGLTVLLNMSALGKILLPCCMKHFIAQQFSFSRSPYLCGSA